MIRIQLSQSERELLEQTFKATSDARLRERCQAVLMAARGRPRRQLAEDLGVHRSSVHRWLRAYEQGGLKSLAIQWAPGQPGRIPEALAPVVVEWVKSGPQGCGLNRANWSYAELADHLYKTHGIAVGETARRTFCHRHDLRPYRPTYQYLRGDPVRQAATREDLTALQKRAPAGECVLLSQDDARFPRVPTLGTPLGVKGHRPVVGPWDNKDLLDPFAALDWVSGRLTTPLVASPAKAKAKTGKHKSCRLQEAFAAHLRDIARAYPIEQFKQLVITLDNAPWHRGRLITEVLAQHPHLELYHLPSYSLQLNVIERLWKGLRRRATHNRLFEILDALKAALRASLCYFQTQRHTLLSLIQDPKKVAKLAAA